MTIAKNKTRREVHLTQDIIDLLQKQAEKENRSLKNLMEDVLIKYANNTESKPNIKHDDL
jgi:hypothetical protein